VSDDACPVSWTDLGLERVDDDIEGRPIDDPASQELGCGLDRVFGRCGIA
jgi:hypothetical protein